MGDLAIFVGRRIRSIRKSRGYTQEQLGEAVGMPQSYIGGIERGEKNISLETLERFMEALDVTPNEIFRSYNEKTLSKQRTEIVITIDNLNNILLDRSLKEIQMIYRFTKDILDTIDTK